MSTVWGRRKPAPLFSGAFFFFGGGGRNNAGSTEFPFSITPQCRCEPVTRPVAPTSPSTSPFLRSCSTSTRIFDRWQHVVHQQRRALHHAPGAATGAKPAFLAAVREQLLCMTGVTADTQKAVLQAPALQEVIELLLHILWYRVALHCQLGEKRRIVLLDQLIQQRAFGAMTLVARCVCNRTFPVGQSSWHPSLPCEPTASLSLCDLITCSR